MANETPRGKVLRFLPANKKGRTPCGARPAIGLIKTGRYLLDGVAAGGTFASLSVSAFLSSGDDAGLAGDPVGDADGEADGLDVAVGAGVAGAGFGVSAFGSQAPRTAAETAKTADNINCLLMIF